MKKSNHSETKAGARPGVWLLLLILFVAFDLLAYHLLKASRQPSADSLQNPAWEKITVQSQATDSSSVFDQYAGSASCERCHEEEFKLWKNSNHALAERPVEPALDQKAFAPTRTVLHGTDAAQVGIEGNQYEVTTAGLKQTQQVFAVQRVIGRMPLRQFLVSFPGGRLQTLAASYDPRSNEWFNVFGGEDRKPGEWGSWTGRGMNWNSMCAACHNTRLQKNYRADTDSYHTTMAEMGVSCEACHGPLKAHDEWQAKFGGSGKKDPTVHAIPRNQILENCASCHARRSDLTGDFKPGDRFHDDFSLAMVDYSDVFYPDGQNHEEDYEYTAFMGSRMHFRGVICLDCHDPHSARPKLPGNWLCMRCHNGSYPHAPVIQPVTHSHHKVFGYNSDGMLTNFNLNAYAPNASEAGGECVNCHMPQTAYMQRHWRHDHGFTIPDPLLTKKFNIPNACNRCHQDKDADWSLDWVEKWYGQKMERPTRQRAEWIARAKNGDAAARNGLLDLLKHEEIPYWRAVEAGMLSPWAGDQMVTDVLLSALKDTNAMVRESSVRALSSLVQADNPVVVAAIQTCLDDPARNVRVAAAWNLRQTLDTNLPAAKELRQYLDVNSDQPAGQALLSEFSFSRGQPEQSLAHIQKAVEWDPFSPPLREELAVNLSALNRSGEALEQLKKASGLAPDNAEIHYELGLAYNETGDLTNTIAELKTSTGLDPKNGRAWYNLGLAQNANGQRVEAVDSLKRAGTLSPGDPQIPYARATILLRMGLESEAAKAARQALMIRPDFTPAQQLLNALHRASPSE